MTSRAVVGMVAGLVSASAVLTWRPLLQSSAWLLPALVMIALIIGVGGAVRLWKPTGVLVAAAQLLCIALVAWLSVLLLEGGSSSAPTPDIAERSMRLLADGVEVAASQSAPVDDGPGLRFIVVVASGLVALGVDLGMITLRRPALAALPLTAAYGVPLAVIPGGSSTGLFLTTAVPFLLLLLVHPRPGPWSAPVHPVDAYRAVDETTEPWRERRRVHATMAATGVSALVAATIVPAALPGLDERPLTVDVAASGPVSTINPILNLKDSLDARSDATLLTYRTDQDSPAPLRIVTADVFDGQTWSPHTGERLRRDQRVQGGLSEPPGLTSEIREQSAVRTTTITVQGLAQTYLPAPYPALRVDIEGNWFYDSDSLNIVGDGEDTQGRSYSVTHLEVDPREEQLRTAPPAPRAVQERFTQLPPSIPAAVLDAARQVTSAAGNDYERAVLLQRYFRSTGGFTYSTNAPSDGGSDAITAFLREKYGFCVQFASTMAVMSRLLGIPARVAIGFLPGEQLADGRWRISEQDAHAWPELWFSGTGWVRFEPTPAIRSGRSPSYAQPETPITAPPSPDPGPEPTASAATAPSAAPTPTLPPTSRDRKSVV